MGWTDPRTWSINDRVEAELLNKHLRDNLLALSSPATEFKELSTSANTTSTSFVDMPGATATITLGRSGNLLALFTADILITPVIDEVNLRFDLDGSPTNSLCHVTASNNFWIMYRWSGLTLGSHTVKVQWKTASGTISIDGTSKDILLLSEIT